MTNSSYFLLKIFWKITGKNSKLCSRLLLLGNDFAHVASNQPSQLQELLLGRYNAIYWSLKLHITFHIGEERALQHEELRNLGSFIKLTSELLKKLPGEEHAVDPGSEVLEIVSTQISASNNECLDFTVICLLIPCCVYSHTYAQYGSEVTELHKSSRWA